MDRCSYCEAEPIGNRFVGSVAWGCIGGPVLLCEYHAMMRYELWKKLWVNGDDEGWLDLAMLVEVANDQ